MTTTTGTRYAEFRTGWPALLAATVGSGVGVTALLFYSLGSFTGALQEEFGWTRTAVSSSFLYTTLVLTIATAPLGWLLDRIGPRRIAFVSVPGLTAALILLSRFDGDLLEFHLLFVLAGLLGAGTTSVVYTKVINSSFFTSRGMALGISLSGLGLAALTLPILVNAVVQNWGWRAGFLALAVLSLAVIPFVFFGIRDTTTRSVNPAARQGATRGEALRSRTFWTLLVGFVLVGGSIPALIPHMVPMLTDAGITPASRRRRPLASRV